MTEEYQKAISSLVACRIKQRRATTVEARRKAEAAVRHAEARAMRAWYRTAPGTKAYLRWSTNPISLQLEAITAVLSDLRQQEKKV